MKWEDAKKELLKDPALARAYRKKDWGFIFSKLKTDLTIWWNRKRKKL